MRVWFVRQLSRPRLPWLLALLGVVLSLPALNLGLVADDYFHRYVLLGAGDSPGQGDPLTDMFAFLPGGEGNAPLRDLGAVPWWSAPELRVRFFRPLTVATQMLDYWLWPNSTVLQHAHNLVWYGIAVYVVATAYRRLGLSVPAAGLAGLLFAVEDAHSITAAWMASRSHLLAVTFSILALVLHVQWRRTGRAAVLVAGMVVAVAGLASAEAALGGFAYIAAWQAFKDEGDWRRRAVGLLPWLLLGGVYAAAYNHFAFGAWGSGGYFDPGKQPLLFLEALAERWPLLLAAQWLPVPVDLWIMAPADVQSIWVLASVLCLVLLAVMLLPLLRRNADARFWALGMGLSLVPMCGAFPLDRLLLFAGIGAFALIALQVQALGWLEQAPTKGRPKRLVAIATAFLLAVHGPVSALAFPARIALFSRIGDFVASAARQAPTDAAVPQQTFVFVTGSILPVAYGSIIREVEGFAPAPKRTVQLASMFGRHRLSRVDERTIIIEPEQGFVADSMAALTRHPSIVFRVGEQIAYPDFTATVQELTDDGRPARVSFRFRCALEDASLRWMFYAEGAVKTFELPAVGQAVVIEPTFPAL